MDQLLFWTDTSSSSNRQVRARRLSATLHKHFTLVRKAMLELGGTESQALKSMNEVLLDSSSTVSDLAKVIDDKYLFFGE